MYVVLVNNLKVKVNIHVVFLKQLQLNPQIMSKLLDLDLDFEDQLLHSLRKNQDH